MNDQAHKHPDRLDLNGNDTLPCVDITKPEFTESQLFDVFTGRARQEATDWMKRNGIAPRGEPNSTHQYVNSLGQLTSHEERG